MTDLETYSVFLPTVMNTAPPTSGVQVDGPLTIPVEPNRLYQSPARWMQVDDWLGDNIAAFQPSPVIIGTKTCPEQYRLYTDRMGSEPRPEYYPDYADFVKQLALNYQPWAIEVWNEPDCPTYSVPADVQYWYGAWVTDEDYYAAGRRYGNLLSCVYPVLHSTGCQVIGGALQNAHLIQGQEFLRGMLETGQCDYVSFHLYHHFNGPDYKESSQAVVDQLREKTDKPLIITEMALLTNGEDTPEFQAAQVEHLVWHKEWAAEIGIPLIYYSSDNTWGKCGLKRRGKLMPVYYAWRA